VVIAAVGDLMFARDVVYLMEQHGVLYPFERALPLFEGAELRIGNLEGTFTNRGVAQQKEYTFRAAPELARGLAESRFDAVTLANNHAVDFGAVSLLDTLAATEAAGVATFGAGPTAAQAYSPRVLGAPSASVALLGFNAIYGSPPAGEGSPGVAWADAAALASISRARSEADFVVVMVHWGVEYSGAPTAEQRAFGRAAIDAGASVVIGAHPHSLQPWERYRDGVILYSLGNFVFDLDGGDLVTLGERPFLTAVARLTLEAGRRPGVEFRPAYIDVLENRPRPATVEEAARVNAALRELTPSE
jgi:poly-gamma-glutamate synthesis protein (capsule biosynthesis protein)